MVQSNTKEHQTIKYQLVPNSVELGTLQTKVQRSHFSKDEWFVCSTFVVTIPHVKLLILYLLLNSAISNIVVLCHQDLIHSFNFRTQSSPASGLLKSATLYCIKDVLHFTDNRILFLWAYTRYWLWLVMFQLLHAHFTMHPDQSTKGFYLIAVWKASSCRYRNRSTHGLPKMLTHLYGW